MYVIFKLIRYTLDTAAIVVDYNQIQTVQF